MSEGAGGGGGVFFCGWGADNGGAHNGEKAKNVLKKIIKVQGREANLDRSNIHCTGGHQIDPHRVFFFFDFFFLLF